MQQTADVDSARDATAASFFGIPYKIIICTAIEDYDDSGIILAYERT